MRAFTPNDLSMVNEWCVSRGTISFEIEDLPEFGMIEENVAVGFMCLCEGRTAFLEAFVTNPNASAEDRDRAIMRIARWIEATARAAGIKQLLCISSEISLIKRAEELGFKVIDTFVGQKTL